jgi:hypothetical protein
VEARTHSRNDREQIELKLIMRNHDIIKKIFEMTQVFKGVKYWDREDTAEKAIKKIEGLIADERPAITGPRWKEVK